MADEDESECEDLREQLKLLRGMYEARKIVEKQKWASLASDIRELLIRVEANSK